MLQLIKKNGAYICLPIIVLILIGMIISILSLRKKENYNYNYPYDYLECVRGSCLPENERVYQYLTDEEAFVRYY